MTVPTCNTCRWFKAYNCFRFPPQPVKEERQGTYDRYVVDAWQRPVVLPDDFCGEYKPKRKIPE